MSNPEEPGERKNINPKFSNRDTTTKKQWNIIHFFLGILAIFMAITFAISAFKTWEIHQLTSENKRLQRESAIVVGTTAKVMAMLGEGYNDYMRFKYKRGRQTATDAIDIIKENTGELYPDSELRQSMEKLIAACKVLQIQCSYFLEDLEKIQTYSEWLIEHDENNWIGYHFLGIYYTEKDNPTMDDFNEAIKNYEKSKKLRGNYNPDEFNIIELYLLVGRYEDVKSHVEKCFEHYPEHDKALKKGQCLTHSLTVMEIFKRIACVLLKENGAVSSLDFYTGLVINSKIDLRPIYGSRAVRFFREQISKNESISNDEKKSIIKALDVIICAGRGELGKTDDCMFTE